MGQGQGSVNRRGTWISTRELHEESSFSVLLETVRKKISHLADIQTIGIDKPRCHRMWGEITDRFGYDQKHAGDDCMLKGIYFVQTPDDSGQLQFIDPRNQDTEKNNATDNAVFSMNEGRLLIFPSWLSYSLTPNQSELNGDSGNRINIRFSFN